MCCDGLKRGLYATDKSLPLPPFEMLRKFGLKNTHSFKPNPFCRPEEDQASLRPGCCTSGTTVLMALAP